eukprot:TRINITY_DN1264_c0_g1_i2.p1 TRINITY_DN1264_c0_g1~~TRINITY_DN1264_c0_g1_i2.p1  ORF type:complete len:221 (-),score=62.69 TRINITY_DN1264_c0_g1_i2:279-941(-)
MPEVLDRATIFNDTKWCYYMLCSGCGIGPMSPLVASDEKMLCIHGTCSTANIGGEDGFCYQISNCLCISEHFAIPPAQGTPPCICFNKWIGTTRETGQKSKTGIFDFDVFMKDTFWIYYLFCMGVGINKMKGPLIQAEFKEICCAGSSGMVPPVEDGIFCSQLNTMLCAWAECQMPPAPGNPKCAILTVFRLNKEKAVAAPKKPTMPSTTQKGPSQEEMV